MLLESGLVAKKLPRKNPSKYFSGYDECKACAYYMGEMGHNVDNCLVLKHKVQALIDSEILELDDLKLKILHGHLLEHQGVVLINGKVEGKY